jgi:LEA14-like dessication related protein
VITTDGEYRLLRQYQQQRKNTNKKENLSATFLHGTWKFLKWLLLILILIGGVAVYFIYNPGKAITLVFPDLDRISSINAVIRKDSADGKIAVVLENKNPYKLVIDTLSFDLALNDTSIAFQRLPLQLDQTSFDADTVEMPLKLSIKKIKGLIKNLQEQDSTWFEARGYVVYETIFGRVKLKFDTRKRIPVPVPPKLRVLKVERKKFSLRDKILYVTTSIEIINRSKKLDLELSDVTYDLRVKETLHSEGSIGRAVKIKPQSSIIIDIPMEVKVYHPLKAAWMIRTDNDRLPYTLKLKGIVKENISDNSYASPAEIDTEGMMELKKD